MTTQTHHLVGSDADISTALSTDSFAATDLGDDTGLAPIGNFGPGFEGAAASGTSGSTSGAVTQVLYLTEPGDSTQISVDDLHQGDIGDCFLISSIGELALFKPVVISNMIKVNSNGTETVTLYEAANGQLPGFGTTSFKPVSITVTNVFPSYSVNSLASQDVAGNQKEIWPQVLEKAVATLDGGYGVIANGGNPLIAMEELTGQAASALSPASVTLSNLQKYIAAGDLITFDSSSNSGLPYNVVSDHAYMFESLSVTNGTAMVTLGNPWGFDQPSAIPLSQISKAFVEVDVGKA